MIAIIPFSFHLLYSFLSPLICPSHAFLVSLARCLVVNTVQRYIILYKSPNILAIIFQYSVL
nr:MAG TPA: hypothetical protein [Caudoviricetes sp.]